MLILTLLRTDREKDYTLGELYINDCFFCHTLEDTDRGLRQNTPLWEIQATKVFGKTAIPAGEYTVRFTFSPRFQRMMLLVENVPGFEGIRIHAGNTAEDTNGCILLGDRQGQGGRIVNSRKRVRRLEDICRVERGKIKLVIEK